MGCKPKITEFCRLQATWKHPFLNGLAKICRERLDRMSDEHIEQVILNEGCVKTFEERAHRKQSIRANTHKLLSKAKANIEAVEKGIFGLGH